MEKLKNNKKLIVAIFVLIILIGITVFIVDNKDIAEEYLFKDKVTVNSLVNEDTGLIFNIENISLKCDTVNLSVFDNGIYQYTYTHLTPDVPPGTPVLGIYLTGAPKMGNYEYDVTKIFQNIKTPNDRGYSLRTGQNNTYTTDLNNESLKEFLASIDIDLDVCMEEVVLTDDLEVKEIVDISSELKGFVCEEDLDQFYTDDEYTYHFNCIRSPYLIVKYTNGLELTISQALNYKHITINDLDKYNIGYIKQKKIINE